MNQRGVSVVGVLMLAALIGGIYVGVSYFPVLSEDYTLKRVARGACNDYLARNVTTPQGVEDMFRRGLSLERMDRMKLTFHPRVDESFLWCELTVSYKRTWTLIGTKKSYPVSMKWTMRQER